MSSFELPLTVRALRGDVDLLVHLIGTTSLSAVLPDIIRLAGLPAGSVLHHGAGAVEGAWILGRAPLLAGCVLTVEPRNDLRVVGPVSLRCVAGPDAGGSVAMVDQPVEVGRGAGCDLVLDDPELSRRHASITWSTGGIAVTDLNSANGVRIDGRIHQRAGTDRPMVPGGLLRLGGSVLRAAFDLEPSLLLTPDGQGHLAVARPARVAPAFDHPMAAAVGPAPERSRRPIPVLAAFLGALAGCAIAVVTGMWSFLLLAALGPAMLIAGAVSDRISGRRSHRHEVAQHRAAVLAELADIKDAVAADRADAWDRYPDPATLARRASDCSTRLWERRPTHPDFLRLSLGIGNRPARVRRTDPPIAQEVPITLDLRRIGVLGLTGECRPLLRHLIGQLAGLHSPAELQVSIFSDQPDLRRIQDLPHAAVDGAPGRLPTDEFAAAQVRRLLGTDDGRTKVVVLDDAHRWRRTAGMTDVLARAAEHFRPGALSEVSGLSEGSEVSGTSDRSVGTGAIRLLAICVAAREAALPVECTAVATVRSGRVDVAAGQATVSAEAAGVSESYLEALVSALAPLTDPDMPGGALPPEVRFSTLCGGQSIPAWVASRWFQPSMSALLGVGPTGPLSVDLEADGPHLLIAGTTGSGKSELLQTLIAGLACAAPPDRTAFLLIDYKGGAAFGRLAALPHTTGVVTDLDETLAARALTSLHAEVRRREQVLRDGGVPDLAALRGLGRPHVPPSLVIVVDEFATLGAELPDFLHGLLDVAQRGRSLGLHLVLATQRPAGVVSPAMKANIGLRICLRVTDDADSLDVIDTAEAARLSAGLPGRALLRHERSRRTLFQVARVSGTVEVGPRVRLRDVAGAEPATGGSVDSGADPTEKPRPELDAIVEAVSAAAAGIRRPGPPWRPALPALVELPDSDPATHDVIALLDRPGEQQQPALHAPPGSVLVLGPPGSGRSCALRRFGWTAAAGGAQLLVIDAGSGLTDMSGWPGVRTHLNGRDPALIQRVVQRLHEELRKRGGSVGPPILLLIDGWEQVSGRLDAMDYGATSAELSDLAARGPATGMRVVLSGDLRLEHHRAADSFTSVLLLGIGNRGDIVPGPPGRGRYRNDEMQIVHCPTRVAAPVATPGAGTVIVVRELPAKAEFSDLPGAGPAAVPIGFGGDDASVRTLDLTGSGGGLLVAGPRRSGVSSTLTVLAMAAATAGIPVVRACLRPIPPLPRPVSSAQRWVQPRDFDLRDGATHLRQLLAEHEGPILLTADEADSWPEDGSALLERFVTVAGPGQYLAVGTRLDRALHCHRGPIAEVAMFRTGILLQADSADGALLDAVLPRRQGQLPAGRGHLVVSGQVTPIQVACW